MRFGLGYLGRNKIGKNGSSLLPGQTFMRAFGAAVVNFIAPTYTTMNAVGTATVNFIGSAIPPGGAALQTDMSSATSEWFYIL